MWSVTFSVIKTRAQAGGIFDVIVRAANSTLAKKVVISVLNKGANSTVTEKAIDSGVAKFS